MYSTHTNYLISTISSNKNDKFNFNLYLMQIKKVISKAITFSNNIGTYITSYGLDNGFFNKLL